MKNKTCCFTGHREFEKDDIEKIKADTKTRVIELIKSGVVYFGAGGARGFDTLAAEIILELKEQFPNIKLILVLPCTNQTRGWNKEDKIRYEYIMEKADKVKVMSSVYYNGCMQARNRHMVDNSSYCICYCRKTSGGTAYTVDYAIKNKVKIIYV